MRASPAQPGAASPAAPPARSPGAFTALPGELRAPILRGLRWTLWLSAVAMPLGYATRLMLARTGPQVIGAFGLLMIYIRLVSTFLLLGGNAVLIQFLPQLAPRQRRDFLLRYGFIVLLALLPWFAVAWFWPATLHWLFGAVGGSRFQVLLIWLSPIYIALSLSTAALKGLLEIAWAQFLGRAVTIGSFLAYAFLFFADRRLLAREYLLLIWGIYLSLAAITAGVGLRVFWRRTEPAAPPLAAAPFRRRRPWTGLARRRPAFRGTASLASPPLPAQRGRGLPPGFWRYTLNLQGNSAIGFLSASLDSLLVLHWGGLAKLGLYVALMTLLEITPTLLDLLLDTLLPSLTHAIAFGGRTAMGGLNEACGRVLYLGALALASFMALFAAPMVALFGPAYHALAPLLRLAAPFAAVLAASHLFNTIFSAIGQPQRSTVAQSARLVAFVALFPPLWRADGLAGAVWTWVAAETAHHLVSLFFVRNGGLQLPFRRGYAIFLLALAGSAGLANAAPGLTAGWDGLAWAGVLGVFLWGAGYQPGEIRAFLRWLRPGHGGA